MDENIASTTLKDFSGLSVLDTPIYLIGFAAIYALLELASFELIEFSWRVLFWSILVMLLVTIVLSIVNQKYVSRNYQLKVKFSRAGAIIAAVGGIVIANDEALRYPFLFWFIVIAALTQIVLFSSYLLIKDAYTLKKQKSLAGFGTPSYLQLALLTSALMIGMSRNSKNYGEHLNLNPANKEKSAFYLPRADNLEHVNFSIREIVKEAITKEQGELSVEKEAEIRRTYTNTLSYEMVSQRYHLINNSLFGCWALTIVLWLFYFFFSRENDWNQT